MNNAGKCRLDGVLSFYTRIRIYYAIKFYNRDLSATTGKKPEVP